jgi:SAM-dependent methyltransferase
MNSAEYARMYEAEERQWWYAGMRAISLALLAPELPRGRLAFLDAGCGTGVNLALLGRLGSAFGVDISEEAIAFCRSRGVVAARGSVLELPVKSATVDAVTSFDVLYHSWVTDDLRAMREMARVLRRDGLLLVRVPALKLLWGAHDAAVHSRHRYTRGELEALLAHAGLTLLRSSYANCFLFPVLLARRTLDRVLGRQGSDVGFLPAPLEWGFRSLLEVEAWLIGRGVSLPIGASLFALARKDG